MNHPNIPNVPLTNSTKQSDFNKKSFSKLEKSKPISSPYINTNLKPKNKNNQFNNQSFHHDQLFKQVAADYQNISNYKINNQQENYQQPKINNKYPPQNISLHKYQSSPPQINNNHNIMSRYTLNERNLYSQRLQDSLKSTKVQQRITQPQPFRNIQQSDTLEDQDEYIQQPSRSKSARNLRIFADNNQKNKRNTGYQIKDKKFPKKSIPKPYNPGQQQQQAIMQNFRVQDLHFLTDQQFLPEGILAPKSSTAKFSNNHSGKSDSNHPVFRDTLQYADSSKYNLHNMHERFMQHNHHSQQISDHSSLSSISPMTNIDNRQGYRWKYRKYKQKYANTVQVVKQFQMLNQTLIKDQRQNFKYYEDTIQHLQHLLLMKDKQIEELHNLLMMPRQSEQNSNRELCSIEGRQLQIQNQRLKKQKQAKQQQIKSLKQNIRSLDQSFQVTQKTIQSQSRNLQKKNQHLKKQKESFLKKIKSLQELNKMYEQKIKDKQDRLNRLSQMNSQLQQQVLRLKSKIHSQQTYDTDRDFRVSFAKKQGKDLFSFSNQNLSKISQIGFKEKNSPQIQKYLSCIDNQLQLIRSYLPNKPSKSQTIQKQNKRNMRQKSMNQLDLIDQFDLEQSLKEQREDMSLKDLINVVDKLNNFRVSMEG